VLLVGALVIGLLVALVLGLLVGLLLVLLGLAPGAGMIVVAAVVGCSGFGLAVFIPRDLSARSEEFLELPQAEATDADAPPELVLGGVDLRGALLPAVDLSRSDLVDAHLAGADLRRAEFYRAELYGADLRGADLRGARLRYASIDSARFDKAIYDRHTTWPHGEAPADAICAEPRGGVDP